MKDSKISKLITYSVLLFGSLILIAPIYLTLVNSFKETKDITANFTKWPNPFTTVNFERLISDGVSTYFINSMIITVASVLLIVVFVPMAAYSIARQMEKKKIFKLLYFFMIIGLFVPFQVIMIPLMSTMSKANLSNTFGLIILYLTLAIPQSLFLYAGFIKNVIPEDIDEAASIDGSTPFTTYWKIIFPLLSPMHATVGILNSLWVWNDFLLPLLMLNKDSTSWTLPLFQFNYQGENFSDFGPSFASYVIGIVSILIVYLIFQKNIIAGVASGSVK